LVSRWSWPRGDAAQVTVLEAVAVSLHRDHFDVVDEAVDHGGHDVVAEHLAPPAEWFWEVKINEAV
jgi:hypothetical protein